MGAFWDGVLAGSVGIIVAEAGLAYYVASRFMQKNPMVARIVSSAFKAKRDAANTGRQ